MTDEVVRACIFCSRAVKVDALGRAWCPRCRRESEVQLCRHLVPAPAWRTILADRGVPVGLTVGDVSVNAQERIMPLVSEETGRVLSFHGTRTLRTGTEVVARLTLIATCAVCGSAYLLPSTEALMRGVPKVLRAPLHDGLQVLAAPRVDAPAAPQPQQQRRGSPCATTISG